MRLFHVWGEHNSSAAALACLGEGLASIKLPDHIKPLPESKAGKDHFFGSLNENYLLALLAERIQRESSDIRTWMLQLRAWTIVHALARYERGVRLDENLQTVSRCQRMACDNSEEWLCFFLSLKKVALPRSFRELGVQLHAAAHQALSLTTPRDSDRRALKAICEIASNRDKPLQGFPRLPLLIAQHQNHSEQWREALHLETEDPSVEVWIGTDNGTRLVAEEVPEEYTPAQRKLSTRTVLFASAEEVHMLPWSWIRPNPIEIRSLRNWIEETLAAYPAASDEAFIAAVIWCAVATGRSLVRTLAFEIDHVTGAEWRFDPNTGNLKRTPPMRVPGWLPDEQAREWLLSTADEICISPQEQARQALLKKYRQTPEARTFYELWPKGRHTGPEHSIGAALKAISPRLTGRMLAEALPLRSFASEQDATLASLIASHPQTPLSGGHSYAQWRLSKVTALLSAELQSPLVAEQDLIGLGSRLAVIDALIINSLRSARNTVVAKRHSGDAIAFHNAYTAYVVIALLAATGARPINSPFESLAQFDLEEDRVFIDDKHGGTTQRTGRMLPLVTGISAFLRKRYLPHLVALAHWLQPSRPVLASDIERLATEAGNGEIPLFFFLDERGNWSEVTRSSIFHHASIDWPLPANLFRHRLPNRLRALGVDNEIIDGIMGHSEWGAETWGHLSFRSWKDDADALRPALNRAFSALKFVPLRGLTKTAAPTLTTPMLPPESEQATARMFGADARERERLLRYRRSVREANFTIREFLGERKLETLNPDELDQLADRLTRTERGMPIPTGGLRLALLIRKLERAEIRTGTRLRPRRERLIANDPPSMFSQRACGVSARIGKICLALDRVSPRSSPGRRVAAVVALAVESRISDAAMLAEVAQGRRYRVVSLRDRYFLEFGVIDDGRDTTGRRFPISNRTTSWLESSRGLDNNSTIDAFGISELLQALPIKSPTLNEVIDFLAQEVEQENVLSLPGVICGVLAGKIETTALGWRDLVRLDSGRKIAWQSSLPKLNVETPLRFKGVLYPASPESRQRANIAFLKAIPRALRTAMDARPGKPNVFRTLRATLDSAIKAGMRNESGSASASLLLLGQWILHLTSPAKGHPPKSVSLLRYWTALAGRFHAELTEFDLVQADSDEITDAYSRVLDSIQRGATTYTVERLAHFHRWLALSFDVEHPDWSQLPVIVPGLGVSPGFVSENEYRESLMALSAAEGEGDPGESVGAAMILLMAYRFGLRRNEALFLTRGDWTDDKAGIVITVEGNRWRKLKSRTSRRQVPLLFNLTDEEKRLVERAKVMYAARHGQNHDYPLLDIKNPLSMIRNIHWKLKMATGNDAITLHHARHSVANLVLLNALGIHLRYWAPQEFCENGAETLLASRRRPSRRHAWAISRFLGHATPSTTLKSYIHFIYEWIDELVSIPKIEGFRRPASVIALDLLPEAEEEDELAIPRTPAREPSLADTLMAYRLFVRGVSAESIAGALGIADARVAGWLRPLEEDGNWTQCGDIARSFSEPTWNRLISWSRKFPISTIPSSTLTAEGLVEMVGEKRQLLAWHDGHFALLHTTLTALEIDKLQYEVFGSARMHNDTRALAERWGFEIAERPVSKSRGTTNTGRPIQIDSATTGPHRELVQSRVAVVFKENSRLPVRNRPQLALLAVALATAAWR